MQGPDLEAVDRSHGVRVEGSFSSQVEEEDLLGLEHGRVVEIFVNVSYKVGKETKTEVLPIYDFVALYREAKRLRLPVQKAEGYTHVVLEGDPMPEGFDILEYVESLLKGGEASGMYG